MARGQLFLFLMAPTAVAGLGSFGGAFMPRVRAAHCSPHSDRGPRAAVSHAHMQIPQERLLHTRRGGTVGPHVHAAVRRGTRTRTTLAHWWRPLPCSHPACLRTTVLAHLCRGGLFPAPQPPRGGCKYHEEPSYARRCAAVGAAANAHLRPRLRAGHAVRARGRRRRRPRILRLHRGRRRRRLLVPLRRQGWALVVVLHAEALVTARRRALR
jgi:hypothetical protein